MAYQPENFTVGWICAIEAEFVVACELLDQEYGRSEWPRIHERDQNSYHFGRMHEHNVAIACLPKGRYGNNSAYLVASHMLLSFPSIRVGLMVGIGGAAPSSRHDIRLGDVVVSAPTPRHGGVLQYDYGKAIQNQEFDETGHLAAPPQALLSALSYLSAQHKRKGHQIAEAVSDMLAKNERLLHHYSRPAPNFDELYVSSYLHSETCLCQPSQSIDLSNIDDTARIIVRNKRGVDEDDPAVHYGLIASANTLLKDAFIRDQLIKKHDALCFEMEAAGLMDNFPCIVIRGISDYADSHKHDQWQGYAAATAAAYAKELLGVISGTEVKTIQPVTQKEILQTQAIPLAARHSYDSSPTLTSESPKPMTLERSQATEDPFSRFSGIESKLESFKQMLLGDEKLPPENINMEMLKQERSRLVLEGVKLAPESMNMETRKREQSNSTEDGQRLRSQLKAEKLPTKSMNRGTQNPEYLSLREDSRRLLSRLKAVKPYVKITTRTSPEAEHLKPISREENTSGSVHHAQKHEEDNSIQSKDMNQLKKPTLVTVDEFLISNAVGLFEIDITSLPNAPLIQQVQSLILKKQYEIALVQCREFWASSIPALYNGPKRPHHLENHLERMFVKYEFANAFFEGGDMKYAIHNYGKVVRWFPKKDSCAQALQAEDRMA